MDEIFKTWQKTLPPGTSRTLTDERRKKIRARLKTYSVDDLLDAVRGWVNDPWPERVNQNDLTILLRSDEQCEKFRDLYRNGAPALKAKQIAPRENRIDADIQRIGDFWGAKNDR